jgi:hypothetical protein
LGPAQTSHHRPLKQPEQQPGRAALPDRNQLLSRPPGRGSLCPRRAIQQFVFNSSSNASILRKMEQLGKPTNPQRPGPFLVGLLLVYGICALAAGTTFSSEFGAVIEIGLVVGLCPFVPLALVHFPMQKGLRWLMVKWMPSKTGGGWDYLWINIPALMLFLVIFVMVASPPSQKAKLKMFVAVTKQAPPPSIQIAGYSMLRGLNDGHCNLTFIISENDLGQLIKALDLSIEQSDLDDQSMSYYRYIAGKADGSAFKFEPPGQLYSISRTKEVTHSQTEIVVGKDRREVLLLDSFF